MLTRSVSSHRTSPPRCTPAPKPYKKWPVRPPPTIRVVKKRRLPLLKAMLTGWRSLPKTSRCICPSRITFTRPSWKPVILRATFAAPSWTPASSVTAATASSQPGPVRRMEYASGGSATSTAAPARLPACPGPSSRFGLIASSHEEDEGTTRVAMPPRARAKWQVASRMLALRAVTGRENWPPPRPSDGAPPRRRAAGRRTAPGRGRDRLVPRSSSR